MGVSGTTAQGTPSRSIEESRRKLPPQSIEAEESVLGGILIDNTALDATLEILVPEDFYRESHRKIIAAMIDLNQRSEPVDMITLSEALKVRGDLQDVGGSAYLATLAERVPTAANTSYYARIVREKSILRGLITTATEIVTDGYEARADVDEFLDQAERKIFEISEQRVRRSFYKVSDILVDSMKAIEQLYERKELVTGVPTGFVDLDRLLAGLQPADLVIIAGRPSMGENSLCAKCRAVRGTFGKHRRRGVLAGNVERTARSSLALWRGTRRSVESACWFFRR